MSIKHPLHVAAAAYFIRWQEDGKGKWKFDPACETTREKMHISLFNDKLRTEHRLCKVDGVLINHEDEVKAILEIDESDNKPTHILGKYFTSAFSNRVTYRENGLKKEARIGCGAAFIQVLKVNGNDKSHKIPQLKLIKKYIKEYSRGKAINNYKLFISKNDSGELEEII